MGSSRVQVFARTWKSLRSKSRGARSNSASTKNRQPRPEAQSPATTGASVAKRGALAKPGRRPKEKRSAPTSAPKLPRRSSCFFFDFLIINIITCLIVFAGERPSFAGGNVKLRVKEDLCRSRQSFSCSKSFFFIGS